MPSYEPDHLFFAGLNRLELFVAELTDTEKLVFDYIKAAAPLLAVFGGPAGHTAAGLVSAVSLGQSALLHNVESRVHHAELERRKGELPDHIRNTLLRYEHARQVEKQALHDLLNQLTERAEALHARRQLAARTAMLAGRPA